MTVCVLFAVFILLDSSCHQHKTVPWRWQNHSKIWDRSFFRENPSEGVESETFTTWLRSRINFLSLYYHSSSFATHWNPRKRRRIKISMCKRWSLMLYLSSSNLLGTLETVWKWLCPFMQAQSLFWYLLLFIYLALPGLCCGMWDLTSSPTRDQIRALCIGSAGSQQLAHQSLWAQRSVSITHPVTD